MVENIAYLFKMKCGDMFNMAFPIGTSLEEFFLSGSINIEGEDNVGNHNLMYTYREHQKKSKLPNHVDTHNDYKQYRRNFGHPIINIYHMV